MKERLFARWLSKTVRLTKRQRQQLIEVLQVPASADPAAGLRLVRCPHPTCGSERLHAWGYTKTGLPRSRCRACHKTSTPLTGTPMAKIQQREKWAAFLRDMDEGLPVLRLAERHEVHRHTARRWTKTWIAQAPTAAPLLGGLVEADELFVRRSAKGRKAERAAWGRRPRKRGEPSEEGSGKRLSEHQPVLMARSRTGEAAALLLPGLTGWDFHAALTVMVDPAAILITDALPALRRAAEQTTLHTEVVYGSADAHCRGPIHVQTVGSTHQRFRQFLLAFHGVSTAHLPHYVRWFLLLEQHQAASQVMKKVLEINTK